MTDVMIRVLGPVEVQAPGGPLSPAPSVRALLARLALGAGRVVSVDALTDALWGEDVPGDAANAVQIRVSKLRRALVSAGLAGDLIATRAPGYRLAVGPEAVDAYRFEREAGAARAATDPATALAHFERALDLWRGTALADVTGTEWTRAERTRLDELRVSALEDRLDVLLELGRHAEAVPDLERLVADHPLRERPHRQLMLALYRAGRQADALAVEQRLRHRLAEELGIDPSPELRTLTEAILRQQIPASPAAAPAARVTGPAAAPITAPAPAPVSGPAVQPVSGPGAAPASAIPEPERAPERAPGKALPRRLASFVGRAADLRSTMDQLRVSRAVTLTGPGGVGKTTLALETARHADRTVGDSVHVIRLAALEPGADVAEAFATQLGLTGPGQGAAAAEAVAEHLRDRRVLLVVDNCEHVVDDAAATVEHLLHATDGVRVLATSREALAVAGETQVAVGPLGVPAEDADLAEIAAAPSVELFLDRARSVRPDFALTDDVAGPVASICRRLDGMPLAIELAAARVKALPPAEIADRLRDRFALLTGGPRTSEARHRTLRATIDWSYDLASEAERLLLRRLAVFRGGWSLAAAERVCGFDGIEPAEVADLLFRLVDRSMVVADPATGRFRLLVTIHDYARARLDEAGEVAAVRDRHLDYFTRLADENGPLTRFSGTARQRLAEEHDNLRAAVDHSLDRAAAGDAEPGLLLAGAMTNFWNYGPRHEGIRAMTALLATGGGSPHGRALALQGIGMLQVYYPTPESQAAARESLAMFEALGDRENAAISKLVVAWEGQYGGDPIACRAMVRDSRAALGDADRGWWRGLTYYVEALIDLRSSAFTESADNWRRSLDLLSAASDNLMAGAVRAHLGIALRESGRAREAVDVLVSAVHESRNGPSPHGLAFSLAQLAHTRLDLGESAGVPAMLDEAEEVARTVRNPRNPAWAAWGRARLALDRGDADAALDDCRRAVELLEDREFPWARARLWATYARAAEAAGRPDEADRARAEADAVTSAPA